MMEANGLHSARSDSASPTSSLDDVSEMSGFPLKPKRKRTYMVRKEEREKLLHEVAELEERVRQLKQLALSREVQQGATMMDAASNSDNSREYLGEFANIALREAIGQHSAVHANLWSLVTEANRDRFIGLLHTPIYLSAERQERINVLNALKQDKLEKVLSLIEERTRFMDTTKDYSTSARFVNDQGDLCFELMDIMCLEGFESVPQVFNAVQYMLTNLEIMISEKLGIITLRDDLDGLVKDVIHSQLVSHFDSTTQQEINIVGFADVNMEKNMAVLALDTVDEDALYPYSPAQRIRRDISAGMVVDSYVRPQDGVPVVRIRRLGFTKVRKPEDPNLGRAFHQVASATQELAEQIFKSLREMLGVSKLC